MTQETGDLVFIITYEKERETDPESDRLSFDYIDILKTGDPEKVRETVSEIDHDLRYMHFLTVYSGDPEDWKTDRLETVNLEEWNIDPETWSQYI